MRCSVGFLVTFLAVAAIAAAQTAQTGGTIEGTMSDSSGGLLAGVEVQFLETSTNQVRTALTDNQGHFRAASLPVGTYEVRVVQPGFAGYVHTGLRLGLGATVRFDIVLQPASVTVQVTVSAQPSPIDPSQTSVTSTVDRERIEELPVRSRNALDFGLLEPGVSSSPQRQGGSPPTALADSGFTLGGLRARSNSVSIDGVDNNDEYNGSSRTELSPEIVQEYQVVNHGFSAEFGGASGGSINVVTRSGSNAIRGDAFLFVQDAALSARDPFEAELRKPNFRRYRAGFSLGGPIAKDHTFYYMAFEQEHNRGENGSDISPDVTSAINNFLASGAFPRLSTRRITAGFFPIARVETEASAKLNHQINAHNSLMLRYAFTNDREAGDAFNTTGLEDASARGSSFTSDNALVGSLMTVFGSEAVGTLRFQVATRRVLLRTNDQQGPGIEIAGLAHFGRPYQGKLRRRESHYQVSYTYLRTKGRHLWNVGTTVNRVREHATALDGFGGLYLFGTLPDFFAGRPDSFRQAFGRPRTDYAITSYGAFAQDHLSLAQHLTLDLGVRYDVEQLPSGLNQDTNNFSPRIGLAYSPASRWVLRLGYGIFFDRYVLANLNRAVEKDGSQAFEQVANGDAAARLFQSAAGGPLSSPAAGISPSVFRPNPRLAASYSQQAGIGFEYLVGHNITASVNYLFVRGVKLVRTRNLNLLPPVVLTPQNAASLGIPNPVPQQIGRAVFGPGRIKPEFNDIYQLEDSASSTYHGLTISLNRRMANGLEFLATYTLSRAVDNASDFDEQPQNSFNLRTEDALSLQHEKQRFVFNALWELPIGEEESGKPSSGSNWVTRVFSHIEVAPIFTVGSGRPVNSLVGLDLNRSDALPLSSRPLGFGRNSLKTPRLVTMDLRALKYFPFGESARLDLVAEFFNLFNHPNAAAINPYFGTGFTSLAGFGQPIQGSGARQVRFSIDFEF